MKNLDPEHTEKPSRNRLLSNSRNLLDNINTQFPNVLAEFDFPRSAAVRQGSIYGYFVSTTRKVIYDEGAAISHVFTNANTRWLMTKGRPFLRAERFRKIAVILDDTDKRFSSCVTGSPSSVLCGVQQDFSLPLDFGLISSDPRVNQTSFGLGSTQIRNVLEDALCGSVNIPEASMSWNGYETLVKQQSLRLSFKSNATRARRAKDVIFSEDLIAYYKGVKFLYLPTCSLERCTVSPPLCKQRPINVEVQEREGSQAQSAVKPLLRQRSRAHLPKKTYERIEVGAVRVLRNCKLVEVQAISGSGCGLWILRADGRFDITLGESFLPWVLTSSFCTCGGLSWNQKLIVCDHRGGHPDIRRIRTLMERNLTQTGFVAYKLTGDLAMEQSQKNSGVREKNVVARVKNKTLDIKEVDAHPEKRNSLSVLSPLLQRNEGHLLEVHF